MVRFGPIGTGDHMVQGFVDLHNHQFAYLGFGGRAFHGRAYADLSKACPWCDFLPGTFPPTPIHGPGGTGDIMGNLLRAAGYGRGLSAALGHKVGGYPEFDGWPRWDSLTHQAVHEDWLFRAVQGGLRLMVMLAVNSEFLCGKANRTLSCNDMEAVDRQLAEAKRMEAYIDAVNGGPGKGWYRIVHTPVEARVVMEAGKLAVVLGIEVDYLFNARREGDLSEDQLRQRLDHYYALGVRHLFPIHFSDNGFGGTAFLNWLQFGLDTKNPAMSAPGAALNPVGTVDAYHVATEDGRDFGYEYRTGRRNIKGLTPLGKTLIREMITRGMIIDVDHMSARSRADLLDICEAASYPVVSGHTGFVELCRGDKRHEGQLLADEAQRIRRLGGMIAIIPGQGKLDQVQTWHGPGQPVIPHTCGNTSNTAIQAYLYAVSKMQGRPVGFGTDFNGFAALPGPRLGKEGCPGGSRPRPDVRLGYPFTAAATGQPMPRSVIGKKTFDINYEGLAHVGMLPDFIADMAVQGLRAEDLAPLLQSAEGYLALWERAWSRATTSRQGALLRDAAGTVFVIYGGAQFGIPTPEIFNRHFDPAMIRQLWDGALDGIPTIPRDGTLLREEGSDQVYLIQGGAKALVTSPPSPNGVCVLWNRALAEIP
jgi:microsomal dipeptidase-like Zn-dependent dipeptidase